MYNLKMLSLVKFEVIIIDYISDFVYMVIYDIFNIIFKLNPYNKRIPPQRKFIMNKFG